MNINEIIVPTAQATWQKPAQGSMTYVLHQDPDGSWRVVCLKAGQPQDKDTIRAILESALSKLGE